MKVPSPRCIGEHPLGHVSGVEKHKQPAPQEAAELAEVETTLPTELPDAPPSVSVHPISADSASIDPASAAPEALMVELAVTLCPDAPLSNSANVLSTRPLHPSRTATTKIAAVIARISVFPCRAICRESRARARTVARLQRPFLTDPLRVDRSTSGRMKDPVESD
jgi:hypothetical protein